MDGARQIVICCDGTNNTVTGRERDTNVLRLYEHILAGADDRQLLYYDPGVGSPDALPPTSPVDWLARKWERVSGLAVGRGAFENIGEAYLFLMRQWTPGTQVWIFGFSRGAFTARSLSGMVQLYGILAPHHDALLPTLLRVYFAPREDEVPPAVQRQRMKMAETIAGVETEANAVRTRGDVAQQLRDGFTSPEGRDAGVHFVGVWDTVAAIGMPGLSLRMSSPARIAGTRIAHARHALALDEHRLSFMPRLYEENDFGTPSGPQSLRQRWFRGVHGDSGGGYAPQESGLSDAALGWMVDEAIACGLRCAPMPPGDARALVHDPVHTVPWWAATGLSVRDTAPLVHDVPGRAPWPLEPVQHPSVEAVTPGVRSVWQRWRAWPPLVLALLGTFVFVTAHGLLLLGRPASLLRAWETGAQFAWMQLSLLWAGTGWRGLWDSVPRSNPVSALLMDFGLVASYAYLLGRWTSWAFVRRAGLRAVGQGVPAWHWLGRALPLAIAGDVFENVMALLAVALEGWPVPVVLWLGGLGALAKWVGLAGCGALLVIGAWPGSRASRAASHAQ